MSDPRHRTARDDRRPRGGTPPRGPEVFVLDTSVFTNPDVYRTFGPDTRAAVEAFLDLARRTPAEFYMPRSAYEELRLMKELEPLGPDFEATVRVRSPRRFGLMIPGDILYEFINEVRLRVDRGLRIAEEHTRMGREPHRADDLGRIIAKLRERYREALRRGILDSREDADVLLLAYELDATLVAADEGLRTWADKVGIRTIEPRYFHSILTKLAKGP